MHTNRVRPHHVLIAASVLIPLLLFAFMIRHDYTSILKDAKNDAVRTANIFQQHALNVFETHQLVAERINDRLTGMSWDEIARSKEIHSYLEAVEKEYPQVQAIWLADASGTVRNASKALPATPVSVADRDYFLGLREKKSNLYIGHIVKPRVLKNINFNVACRRGENGEAFDGVIVVTVYPEYFSNFWNKVSSVKNTAAVLIRGDGEVLARSRGIDLNRLRLPADSEPMKAIRGSAHGSYIAKSVHDGVKRFFVYQKLEKYNVYLIHGVSLESVHQEWWQHTVQLGIVFVVALVVLLLLASSVIKYANGEQAAKEALRLMNHELEKSRVVAENKNRLLEAVMEALPTGIAITDDKGGTIRTNTAFERIWGEPRTDTLSVEDYSAYQAWWTDSGEAMLPEQWAAAVAVRTGETVVGQALRIRRFDGSELFVINSAAPVRNAVGEIVGSAVAIQDVTEIRRAHYALQLAKEEWERTFDSVPDLIAIIDNQNRFLRVNKAMAASLDIDPQECLGLPVNSAIHGSGIAPVSPTHTIFMADQAGHETEVFESALGCNFLVTSTPLFDNTGNLYATVHVARDITRLKHAETELRRSEELFRNIFDHAATGIAITDISGAFVRCNDSYCVLLGYSAEELATRTFQMLIHPDDHEQNIAMIRQLLAGELPSIEIENRYVHKNGQPVWVHKYVSLLRDDHARPTHIVALVTDMSERKKTDETLRFIGQCGSGESRDSFFHELARYLAQELCMDFVCVDRLEEGNLTARTLAVFHDGRFEDNISYSLKDTPCGDVVGRQICSFQEKIQERFPRDEVLQELGAESYLGVTLWSSQGEPIGLIAVIGRKPLADTRRQETLLQLVAVRAAYELERLQTEETLRQQEERLRLALIAGAMATWDWHIPSGNVIWNEAHFRMMGYEPGEVTPSYRAWLSRVHPEDAEAAEASIQQAMQKHLDYTMEFRSIWPDGTIRWLEARGSFVTDQDNQPERSFGVMLDITERKQTEQALRLAHDELELRVSDRTEALAETVESLLEEISQREKVEKNLQRLNKLYGVLSETNQAIVRVTSRDSLFSAFCRIAVEHGGFLLSWVGLVGNDSGQIRIAASCGAIDYLKDIRISKKNELHGRGPTGKALREGTYSICNDFQSDPCTAPWHDRAKSHGIHSSASIALKEGGVVIGALTLYAAEKDFFDQQHVKLLKQMSDDISFALDYLTNEELRQGAERALREETLERLRAVESLREQEQLLIQQSRQAAMGEMIGNIAHQWRQPLNSLGLFTQRLGFFYGSPSFNKEFLDASVARSMELIQYMSRTIDDFRNFFTTEQDKSEFKVEEAVRKALALVEAHFKEHRIRIEITNRMESTVYGFPNEYAQVLLNILINAKDALYERNVESPCLNITVDANQGKSVLTISDNAGGIPEDIIGKIFDPYFTTKGPQQGTGVGLFMSKTIIENKMGGKLSVRNIDAGAEFRIEL